MIRRVLKLAVPVVAIVALGACSGSSDNAAETVAAQTVAVAQETGAAASETGAAATSGDFNDADVTFAQGMIPHHQQAVEMAVLALDPARKAGGNVSELAKRIQGAQGPEIELMTQWLTSWGKPVEMAGEMEGMDHSNMDGMAGMMTAEEMTELEATSAAAFDTTWTEMMIRHHEGALTMAKDVQSAGQNAAVKELAGKIITGQTAEIQEMQTLLKG